MHLKLEEQREKNEEEWRKPMGLIGYYQSDQYTHYGPRKRVEK